VRRHSNCLVASVVLSTPLLGAAATPQIYALDGSGTIYSVGAGGSYSTFVSDAGGFALAADGIGNLYVNNTAWTVSKITPSGNLSTYAFANGSGNGPIIHGPNGFAFNSSGQLFSTNPADGTISVTAPGGGAGSVSTFVTGLAFPSDLAVGPNGDLYASSGTTDVIYQITPSGSVSTFATVNGGTSAGSLAFDSSGNLLFVTNTDQIDKISGGIQSTYITVPTDSFGNIAFDSSGNLYATTQYDTIIQIPPGGGSENTFATLPTDPINLVVVPEPISAALVALSAGACLLRRRRSR
jgi:sugar lactone lactonase YvrE